MSGNLFLDALYWAFISIGAIVMLFSIILIVVSSQERESPGLFVGAVLFCGFLIAAISLLVFI